MQTPALQSFNLSKSFGKLRALDDVSFSIPSRSIFGLLGPNGAGKTTLFSLVAHFIHADRGHVEVLGVNIKEISKLKGRLTILPQDALFQKNVPIIEQLAFFSMLNGKNRKEAEEEVKRTLERVGLSKYQKRGVHALSHGMIKRLGIAQAFLGEPEVILLDEPLAGLDPQNARQIRDLIREFRRERATIVVSSHNMAEIQELCDHVAILNEGKLLACGPMEEVTRAGHEVDLQLSRALSSEEEQRILALPAVTRISEKGPQRYTVSLDLSDPEHRDPDALLSKILQSLLDWNITPRRVSEGQTLEEHFLRIVGQRSDNPA